jgi:hypothetical protein
MRDGRNEAQTSKRPRLGCSSRERVDCGMTSGYCRERARCDLGQDVLQETRISSRFPSHGRPRLISETRGQSIATVANSDASFSWSGRISCRERLS